VLIDKGQKSVVVVVVVVVIIAVIIIFIYLITRVWNVFSHTTRAFMRMFVTDRESITMLEEVE
jgi:flagellar biogenesis protein FliO